MEKVSRQTSILGRLVIGLLALLLALPLRGQQEPLTHACQIRELSVAEAAKSHAVKLRGTLTYYSPDWNGFFLQDETGAIYVILHTAGDIATSNLQPGIILEITGATQMGAVHCDVVANALRVIGTGPLPPPLDLSVTNRLTLENERLRVKATGQIFTIERGGGWPGLQLLTSGGLILDVSLQSGSMAEAESLREAPIELEGVLALELTAEKKPTGRFNLLVTGMDAIHKTKCIPIIPIGDLVARGQQARIRGRVEELRPGFLLMRDFSGAINVECQDKTVFGLGAVIEVSGYPAQRSTGLVLAQTVVTVVTNENPALPVINKIAQIRDLSVTQAARGFPVSVRGVVTYNDPGMGLQFVQDNTAGIYVNVAGRRLDVFPAAGSRIELLGFTGPGEFAPVIEAEAMRIIGPGKFPNAAPAPFQLLMTGAEDSQWIELNGVVRSSSTTSNLTSLTLSTGDALVQMTVFDATHPAPSNCVGASIVARGVCRTLFDDHRHLKGIGFCVPDWDQVEIKEEEVADPFQLPLCPVNELFEFHGGGYGLNRSHVRGRTTLRQRDGTFFLQDSSGGILVQPSKTILDTNWVEVVGFPALKDQLPVLQDALLRPMSPPAAPPVSPVWLSPESALDEALNGVLVTLDGRVLAQSHTTMEETVTLQFGQRLIDAIMERSDGKPLPQFLPGSTVRFTGVYVARLDNNRQIQSFQILLRSPADAVVISVPPWWTARHALYVFGGLGGVLLLSLAWVAGLRGQVRRRTAELCAEIEERKRVEAQVEKAHRELIDISRQAGMAEVATSVLHNVGNVLNSVNVSATLLLDNAKKSNVASLSKAIALLNEHSADLGDYLTNDAKGRQVPGYLTRVTEHLTSEQQKIVAELESLRQNIEHIKEIVAMQQSYARISGVAETVQVTDLVEDALRLNEGSLARHDVKLVRDFQEVPPMSVEKHKMLQILVNLIQNAKEALAASSAPDKRLTLQVGRADGGQVRIAVIDNGMGIAQENLTRIFAHGFTTRKGRHGFGLHSGSLAAHEMGGSLKAHSDGPGKGATFTLEFPAPPNESRCATMAA